MDKTSMDKKKFVSTEFQNIIDIIILVDIYA